MTDITGILLAAGSSRRFGADKLTQVLPNGEWVAVRACQNLMAGVDKVMAVVRPGNSDLVAALQAVGAEVVICPHAEQGMGVSLAFGVRAAQDADAWLVALADMPWLLPATIVKLSDSLRSGASLVAPQSQRRRGHPVGFAKTWGVELMNLSGDMGAKNLLQAHQADLHLLACADPGIFKDIDTTADLQTSIQTD
jgi:molybdenum cofactor cytidylyltransferase